MRYVRFLLGNSTNIVRNSWQVWGNRSWKSGHIFLQKEESRQVFDFCSNPSTILATPKSTLGSSRWNGRSLRVEGSPQPMSVGSWRRAMRNTPRRSRCQWRIIAVFFLFLQRVSRQICVSYSRPRGAMRSKTFCLPKRPATIKRSASPNLIGHRQFGGRCLRTCDASLGRNAPRVELQKEDYQALSSPGAKSGDGPVCLSGRRLAALH